MALPSPLGLFSLPLLVLFHLTVPLGVDPPPSGPTGPGEGSSTDLREQLEARIGQEGDSIAISVAYLDLGSGTRVEIAADREFHAASTMKVPVLLEHLTPDSVQATMNRIGAPGMKVLRGVSDIPAFEAGLSNRATARSYLRSLEVIAQCEITSREACRDMMEILEGQEFTSELPAGIPAEARAQGTRVGNKTGSITGILHDGAIVRPHHADPYILIILTEGYDDHSVGSAAMAELSRLVWTHHTASP